MSVRANIDIFCDNCGNWEHITVSHTVDKQAARKKAKAKGWGRVKV